MNVPIFTLATPGTGKLSLMARPRGGDWLSDETQSLKEAGVTHVVSLLTQAETAELDLTEEAQLCQKAGLEFLALPISDRQCPPFTATTFEFIDHLAALLTEHKHLVIHCRMGIGRSALIASAILVTQGLSTEAAFELVEAARGRTVPDTQEQIEWVQRFEHYRKIKSGK